MTGTILALALIGILAVLAELVLPGGILGVVGAGCLVTAVILCFSHFGFAAGAAASAALGVFAFLVVWGWMKNFHRLPFTRKLILKDGVPKGSSAPSLAEFIGKTGETVTELMPSGAVSIGEEKHDAMTETGSIPRGTAVEVIGVSGASLVVRALAES